MIRALKIESWPKNSAGFQLASEQTGSLRYLWNGYDLILNALDFRNQKF
jgi:hypothetical protein